MAVPTLAVLAAECPERCSGWNISQMEIVVLTALDWNVHCNTAYDFLGALGLGTLVRDCDELGGLIVGMPSDAHRLEIELLIRRYAEFFADLAVYEYTQDAQPASLTAAASVAAARVLFNIQPRWPESMTSDSGYSVDELQETICHLLECARVPPSGVCARAPRTRRSPRTLSRAALTSRRPALHTPPPAVSSCTTLPTTGSSCKRWRSGTAGHAGSPAGGKTHPATSRRCTLRPSSETCQWRSGSECEGACAARARRRARAGEPL
jgi:hypothetical protein